MYPFPNELTQALYQRKNGNDHVKIQRKSYFPNRRIPMSMTSRQRVQAVLNHKIPDRVPIILGVSNATGIKMTPYQGLKKILGIQGEDQYIYDWPELGTALPAESILQRLHSDVRPVFDRFPRAVMERNQKRSLHSPCIDDWGGGQIEIEPGVWFPGHHPLPEATTTAELNEYAWPDMDDPYRVALVKAQARKLADENQYAILADVPIRTRI
jgi:hypothetical protein